MKGTAEYESGAIDCADAVVERRKSVRIGAIQIALLANDRKGN